mmetsp:Transcript_26155/g.25769  ORF Transcript_26155/g.25769 Transcript_26155/m.25769 type:complete len:163 (+) Transcript_26155:44-532(+)
MLGNAGAGKTSLMIRFSENQFIGDSSTISFDFKFKKISLNGKTVKLQVWDTAGQERFRTMSGAYYRGAEGCIVVFDITDRNSFNAVSNWIREINTNGAGNSIVVIVGSKADLRESRQVSYDEAKDFTDQNHMSYIEVSSLDGHNVEEAFALIANKMIFKQTN